MIQVRGRQYQKDVAVALTNHMRVSWFAWLAMPSWKPTGTILVSVGLCGLVCQLHTNRCQPI